MEEKDVWHQGELRLQGGVGDVSHCYSALIKLWTLQCKWTLLGLSVWFLPCLISHSQCELAVCGRGGDESDML